MFESLTRYLEILKDGDYGEFIPPEKDENGVYVLHGFQYSKDVDMLEQDVYSFAEKYPKFNHTKYSEILDENGIDLQDPSLFKNKLQNLDPKIGSSTFISPNFTTLICKKCGHVDIFYDHKGLELKVSEYKKSMSDIEFKINEVKKTLNEIDKQYKDNLAEIEDIQNKLSSDEITVREQKELTEKANILKQATRNYNYERKKIEGKIKELEVAKHRIINPHISDED